MTQGRPEAATSAEYAARLMLNVPSASISMTDLKPFDVSSSAVARKFPAACTLGLQTSFCTKQGCENRVKSHGCAQSRACPLYGGICQRQAKTGGCRSAKTSGRRVGDYGLDLACGAVDQDGELRVGICGGLDPAFTIAYLAYITLEPHCVHGMLS